MKGVAVIHYTRSIKLTEAEGGNNVGHADRCASLSSLGRIGASQSTSEQAWIVAFLFASRTRSLDTNRHQRAATESLVANCSWSKGRRPETSLRPDLLAAHRRASAAHAPSSSASPRSTSH